MTEAANLLVEVRAQDPRPIYVQIMDEVRRAVALGDLERGDPLPSVRRLASRLTVNPNTVAKAYRELEAEGTVRGRRGKGTFVAPTASPEEERRRLVREVARRALRDARRHGLSPEQLAAAVRREAEERERSTGRTDDHGGGDGT